MIRSAAPAAALVTVLIAVPAAAQSTASRSITVNGTAEVKVPPNEVILTVGVETDSLDIVKARAGNDQRVKAIVEVVRSHAVASEHVQTDFLDLQPRYNDSARREFLRRLCATQPCDHDSRCIEVRATLVIGVDSGRQRRPRHRLQDDGAAQTP